ncbi:hypothetical protein AV650_23880 [Serratia fonticola]|nr:hypothetical protein AV650_23880 [Serratia fonticola]
MADYINSNILAQAYVHVDPKNFNISIDKFTDEITDYAKKRVSFFISDDVEITVELLEGSIISKITIYGTLIASLMGNLKDFVKEYPDFQEGVKVMYNDVTMACDAIICESLFLSNSKRKEVIRLESRKGIIGSVDRIITQINSLKNLTKMKEPSARLAANNIISLSEEITKLLDNIKDDEDKKYIKKELLKLISDLHLNKSKVKKDMEIFYNEFINEKSIIIKKLSN